jgi:hypothetical protein
VEGVLETTPHIFIKWQIVCFVIVTTYHLRMRLDLLQTYPKHK